MKDTIDGSSAGGLAIRDSRSTSASKSGNVSLPPVVRDNLDRTRSVICCCSAVEGGVAASGLQLRREGGQMSIDEHGTPSGVFIAYAPCHQRLSGQINQLLRHILLVLGRLGIVSARKARVRICGVDKRSQRPMRGLTWPWRRHCLRRARFERFLCCDCDWFVSLLTSSPTYIDRFVLLASVGLRRVATDGLSDASGERRSERPADPSRIRVGSRVRCRPPPSLEVEIGELPLGPIRQGGLCRARVGARRLSAKMAWRCISRHCARVTHTESDVDESGIGQVSVVWWISCYFVIYYLTLRHRGYTPGKCACSRHSPCRAPTTSSSRTQRSLNLARQR